MKTAIAILLAAMLLPARVFAQSPEPDRAAAEASPRTERDPDRLGWYVPDFVRLQTGGFVGMFAVGTGYAIFDDILNVSVHYGFTPAEHAGNDVHALSFEALIRPFDFRVEDLRIVPIYAGPGLLYAWGDEFFSEVPDRFARIESDYYVPTSWHWTVRAGIELDYVPRSGLFERHGVYYEVTLLDSYFEFYRENPETLDFEDTLAGAIGYRAAF